MYESSASGRIAVAIAERVGWLLDVDRKYIEQFERSVHGEPASAARRWQTYVVTATKRDGWSVAVSPQFYRTISVLGLSESNERMLNVLVPRLCADPRRGEANAQGVRSIDTQELAADLPLPPFRIIYIVLEQMKEVFVLAALPRKPGADRTR